MKEYEFEFEVDFVLDLLKDDEEEAYALNLLKEDVEKRDIEVVDVIDLMKYNFSADAIVKVINAKNKSNFIWLASEKVLFGGLDRQLEAIAYSLLSSYNEIEDMFDLLIEKLKNAETYFYFRVRDDWLHIIEEEELQRIFDEIEKEVRQCY